MQWPQTEATEAEPCNVSNMMLTFLVNHFIMILNFTAVDVHITSSSFYSGANLTHVFDLKSQILPVF